MKRWEKYVEESNKDFGYTDTSMNFVIDGGATSAKVVAYIDKFEGFLRVIDIIEPDYLADFVKWVCYTQDNLKGDK